MDLSQAEGLTSQEANQRLLQFGRNEIVEHKKSFLLKIVSELWQPVPWMLESAIILQIAIGERVEATVIATLLIFNAALSYFQKERAQAALSILKSRLSVRATVKRDGAWQQIPAPKLVPGDVIKLELGSLIPADACICKGSILLDQSMLTGESTPVEVGVGAVAYSGAIGRRGEAIAKVVATGARSYYGKTAELVRIAGATSAQQVAVLGVVRNLAVFNGVVTVLLIAYAHSLTMPSDQLVALALTAVLASIPVALPATFTLAAALGAQALARKGVLLTRLNAVLESSMVDVICVDKTGTLTSNQLGVAAVTTVAEEFKEVDVLRLAALASSTAGFDPVDAAIRAAVPAGSEKSPVLQLLSFTPFDPTTKVAEAVVIDEMGREQRIVKGAPIAISRRSPLGVLAEQQIDTLSRSAGRVIAVAFGPTGSEKLVGLISLSDPPRPESKPLIAELRNKGVATVMVTGDAPATAASVGHAVGLTGPVCSAEKISEDSNMNDFAIYAGVFPEDKFNLVRAFQRRGHVVGMCGDGVNDAPALRQAQMGVAVSTASDVAKSAASIVLTEPGLKGVVDAIEEGRSVFQRILTYTLNALVKKFQLVPFLGVALLVTDHAIVTPIQMVLLMITGDFLTMAIATDRATPSSEPDVWRLGAITGAAATVAFGGLLFLSAIVLFGSRQLNLNIEESRTLAFVALVFLGQVTVYVLRDRRSLWSSAPSKWLLVSSASDIAIAILLGQRGWFMAPLPAWIIVELFFTTLLFAFLLDLLKSFVFERFGLTSRNKVPVTSREGGKSLSWLLATASVGLVATVAIVASFYVLRMQPLRNTTELSRHAPAEQIVTLQGKVMATKEQLVSARIGGIISILECDVGKAVRQKQLCAKIHGIPYQRALEKLETAKHQLVREKSHFYSQAPRRGHRIAQSAKNYRRLLARIREEQSRIHLLHKRLVTLEKENLAQTEIRAPFDAIVVARYVSLGQKVTPSSPVFLFQRGSARFKVELYVSQDTLRRLNINDPAEITSDIAPNHAVRGKITEISNHTSDAEVASGLGRVIIEAPKSGDDFAAGLSVETKIKTTGDIWHHEPRAPSVPSSGF
jgi:H+-transporting ATPase